MVDGCHSYHVPPRRRLTSFSARRPGDSLLGLVLGLPKWWCWRSKATPSPNQASKLTSGSRSPNKVVLVLALLLLLLVAVAVAVAVAVVVLALQNASAELETWSWHCFNRDAPRAVFVATCEM